MLNGENIFPILLFIIAGIVGITTLAFLAWGLWFYRRFYGSKESR